MSIESDVRTTSFSSRTATERILKSRLNDFHGTSDVKRTVGSREEMERMVVFRTYTHNIRFLFYDFVFFFISWIDIHVLVGDNFVKQFECNF